MASSSASSPAGAGAAGSGAVGGTAAARRADCVAGGGRSGPPASCELSRATSARSARSRSSRSATAARWRVRTSSASAAASANAWRRSSTSFSSRSRSAVAVASASARSAASRSRSAAAVAVRLRALGREPLALGGARRRGLRALGVQALDLGGQLRARAVALLGEPGELGGQLLASAGRRRELDRRPAGVARLRLGAGRVGLGPQLHDLALARGKLAAQALDLAAQPGELRAHRLVGLGGGPLAPAAAAVRQRQVDDDVAADLELGALDLGRILRPRERGAPRAGAGELAAGQRDQPLAPPGRAPARSGRHGRAGVR